MGQKISVYWENFYFRSKGTKKSGLVGKFYFRSNGIPSIEIPSSGMHPLQQNKDGYMLIEYWFWSISHLKIVKYELDFECIQNPVSCNYIHMRTITNKYRNIQLTILQSYEHWSAVEMPLFYGKSWKDERNLRESISIMVGLHEIPFFWRFLARWLRGNNGRTRNPYSILS